MPVKLPPAYKQPKPQHYLQSELKVVPNRPEIVLADLRTVLCPERDDWQIAQSLQSKARFVRKNGRTRYSGVPHHSAMMVLSQIISIYAYDGQRNLNKSKSRKINFESCIYMVKKKNKDSIYSSRSASQKGIPKTKYL